jgi:hypothetical protein
MIRLSTFALDVLREAFYLRVCGAAHIACWSCGSDLHAGMLIHVGPQGAAHARCLVPGRDVHQLHGLLTEWVR